MKIEALIDNCAKWNLERAVNALLLMISTYPLISIFLGIILVNCLYEIFFPRRRLCKKCKRLFEKVDRDVVTIREGLKGNLRWQIKNENFTKNKGPIKREISKTTFLSDKGVEYIDVYEKIKYNFNVPKTEANLIFSDQRKEDDRRSYNAIKIGDFLIVEKDSFSYQDIEIRTDASLKAMKLVISELKHLLEIKRRQERIEKKKVGDTTNSKKQKKRRRKRNLTHISPTINVILGINYRAWL